MKSLIFGLVFSSLAQLTNPKEKLALKNITKHRTEDALKYGKGILYFLILSSWNLI